MKKSILVLALAAWTLGAHAGEVSAERACAAVAAWCEASGTAFGDLGAPVSATPHRDASGALLWHVVAMEKGGTVVAAGDDRVEPVLAVLPAESFAGGVIPKGHPLAGLLETDVRGRLVAASSAASAPSGGAVRLLAAAPATLSADARAAQAKWRRLAGADDAGAARVALFAAASVDATRPPLVFGHLPGFSNGALTHWNQGASRRSDGLPLYNYYTPGHYVCGCVATAGAAILQYFNVTNGPVAVTNACTFNAAPTNLVTIGGLYDWSILPKGMGGRAEDPAERLTDAQRELLGRVTYDVGVCLGMQYDANGTGSGAQEETLATVLKERFGFKTAELVSFTGDKGDAAYYDRFIYNQLRCGAPVGLAIVSSSGGHSVLAVGYGEDFLGTAYTRVFMGWGGSGDAWYNLPQVESYPYLVQAVTQLSLDGKGVPVCGRARVPVKSAASEDHSADGLAGAAFAPVEIAFSNTVDGATGVLTNYTGANGCFGVRLPEGCVGTVTCGGTSVAFGATADDASAGEGADEGGGEGEEPSELEAAYALLPETLSFTLGEAEAVPDYPTPAAARAAANRRTTAYPNGRPLLLVSGRAGDAATAALQAMLAARADEIREKFVLYYADFDTDGYGLRNGVPALAVFNPAVFDPARGWAMSNGCLGGLNLAAANEAGQDFVDASVTGRVPTEEELDALLASAYEKWTRLAEGNLSLRIAGVSGWADLEKGLWHYNFAPGGYAPAAGVASSFTNGESVTATAPAVYTNAADGVASARLGWVIVPGTGFNVEEVWLDLFKARLSAEDPAAYAAWFGDTPYEPAFDYLAQGDGDTAAFQFGDFAAADVTLVWLWEDAAYRIATTVTPVNGEAYVGTVDPAEAWVAPGETFTVTAVERVGGSEAHPVAVVFAGWGQSAGGSDHPGDVLDGCLLTLRAEEPRDVTAFFRKGGAFSNGAVARVGVAVDAMPAELKDMAGFPLPAFGGTALAYGANADVFHKGQQAAVTLAAEAFTDATGGVWRCTGWTAGAGDIAATGACARVAFTASQESSVTFVWEAAPAVPDAPLELELAWADSLDNLASGDDVPAGQNVLVAAADLPANFNLADYSPADVQGVPTGWIVQGLRLDAAGNLVAVLALDEAVLAPQGVAGASPLSIAVGGDGAVTVSASVSNAAKGFWYALYAAESPSGPWQPVASAAVQARQDGALGAGGELAAVADPADGKKFYKLVVTEKRP